MSAVRASSWVVVGYVITFALKFLLSLVLTRFLSPDVFGVAMLAITILSALSLATDLGLHIQLLRISDTDFKNERNSIWTMQIIHGFVRATLLILAAAICKLLQSLGRMEAGSAFASDQLPLLLAALSLVPIVQGFQTTETFHQMRLMVRRPLVILEVSAQIISIVAVISYLQFVSHDVWALFVGWIMQAVAHSCLGYSRLIGFVAHRIEIHKSVLIALRKYGPWLWASSLVHVLASQADKLIFGAVASSTWLGLYSVALSLILTASGVISGLISNIGLPGLSRAFHAGQAELRRDYAKYALLADWAVATAVVAIHIVGGTFIRLVFPEKFHSAAVVLELAAFQIFSVRAHLTSELLSVTQRFRGQFLFSLMKGTSGIVCLGLGYLIAGPYGAVLGISIGAVLLSLGGALLEIRLGMQISFLRIVCLAALALLYASTIKIP